MDDVDSNDVNDEEDDGNVAEDDCKDGDKGGTPDDDSYGNVVEDDGNDDRGDAEDDGIDNLG